MPAARSTLRVRQAIRVPLGRSPAHGPCPNAEFPGKIRGSWAVDRPSGGNGRVASRRHAGAACRPVATHRGCRFKYRTRPTRSHGDGGVAIESGGSRAGPPAPHPAPPEGASWRSPFSPRSACSFSAVSSRSPSATVAGASARSWPPCSCSWRREDSSTSPRGLQPGMPRGRRPSAIWSSGSRGPETAWAPPRTVGSNRCPT